MDRLMSEPNYEDLMQVVNKQNRFAVVPKVTRRQLRDLENSRHSKANKPSET